MLKTFGSGAERQQNDEWLECNDNPRFNAGASSSTFTGLQESCRNPTNEFGAQATCIDSVCRRCV
jgi:hypothetical protein